MTSNTIRRLRERIARTPANGRGYRQYDQALQQDVASYAAGRRARGDSYSLIAKDLGLASATLLNWKGKESSPMRSKKRPMGFRPVTLQTSDSRAPGSSKTELHPVTTSNPATRPGSQPVVVLPGGVRIEGMAVGDVAELVRSMGCLP